MSARRIRLAVCLVLASSLGLCLACPRPGSRTVAPPSPAPSAAPPPAPAPVPGAREFDEAMTALKFGDRALAVSRLEAVVAMGTGTPSRGEALFTLGILSALPDNPSRDVERARVLLQQSLASGGSVPSGHAIRLILALLAREDDLNKSIADLKAQIEASHTETEETKTQLAQRETELRRIKDILLGKTPGS
ncbi:MAG: hypothetical protein HY049_11525 [Acidobacteria bacterium]|nr:hypothetical protein [Acidobacteriota bacterium]